MSKSSDEKVIEELYRRYGAQVERRCQRILGNRAEALDATHEVFMKLLEHPDAFAHKSEWMTWLYRVATNACLNRLRAARIRQEAWLLEPQEEGASDHLEESTKLRQFLSGVFEGVDETTQTIAIHYFVDEMNQEEIAQLVGLSRVTVNKRLMAFRELARTTYEKDETVR